MCPLAHFPSPDSENAPTNYKGGREIDEGRMDGSREGRREERRRVNRGGRKERREEEE